MQTIYGSQNSLQAAFIDPFIQLALPLKDFLIALSLVALYHYQGTRRVAQHKQQTQRPKELSKSVNEEDGGASVDTTFLKDLLKSDHKQLGNDINLSTPNEFLEATQQQSWDHVTTEKDKQQHPPVGRPKQQAESPSILLLIKEGGSS